MPHQPLGVKILITIIAFLVALAALGFWINAWATSWPPSFGSIIAALVGGMIAGVHCFDRALHWDVSTWDWKNARVYSPRAYAIALFYGGPLGILIVLGTHLLVGETMSRATVGIAALAFLALFFCGVSENVSCISITPGITLLNV